MLTPDREKDIREFYDAEECVGGDVQLLLYEIDRLRAKCEDLRVELALIEARNIEDDTHADT